MARPLISIPQVAVLLPTSMKVCRDMRRGVLQYAYRHGPWGLHIIEGREGEQKLIRMREWGCTGVIGRLYTPELAQAALAARVPLVVMEPGGRMPHPNPTARYSSVRCDTAAVGRTAAEYFLERKFTQFAYVGEVHGVEWSVSRGEGFAEAVRAAGFECHQYGTLPMAEQEDAALERDRLCAWLLALPKPIALLAAMDNRGRQVLDACARAGIQVPAEMAVLSVDNDEDLCETTLPPMSSILLDAERASYEGAHLLDMLMRRAIRKKQVLMYGPARVVSRRSTDAMQLADGMVIRALEFIALNACSGIGVPDVARHVSASRRLIEIRFRDSLGKTILEEIQRVRLERVCMLLRETNRQIGEIVRFCGFDSESHVSSLFRRRFGCSMRDYRKTR